LKRLRASPTSLEEFSSLSLSIKEVASLFPPSKRL